MGKTRLILFLISMMGLSWLGLLVEPAQAQLLGANTPGDYGLQSATQPPPGFFLSGVYFRYDGEKLLDADGNSLAIDPDEAGELDVNAFSLGAWWVTKTKIFGGNYGLMIFPGVSNNALESPILGLTSKSSTGFGDLYVQPINLGWHSERADYLAGLGVYMPTGRYSAGASDNLGLGMWSFEAFAGATLYFSESRNTNFAATVYFETHTDKEGTDQKVGSLMTIEGGLGTNLAGGKLALGVSFYAQWKLSDDQLGPELEQEMEDMNLGKNKGYGIGPEAVYSLTSKTKYIGSISLRYLWETDVRSSVQGRIFVVTATFPLPSISLE